MPIHKDAVPGGCSNTIIKAARDFRDMTAQRIKDIMTTGVISVGPDETVQHAVDIMAERSISCVVVTDTGSSKNPIGIITERDLVRRVLQPGKNPKRIKNRQVMTTSLVTISEEATLEEGMRIISSMKIRRLPVVNKEGLIGIVTYTDIVNETMDIHANNKRLMFHQNIQSIVILALAALFLIVIIVRALLA